tara:strand:- start:78 stop:524 length:447 start_codon:yes stop_codon:yes gene_type:complete
VLLKQTQKNRLLDQIDTVVNESKILLQQTIISKNYLNFHSNYTELKSFLEKIETNSDQELKNKIRQLPSLPSPNKSFSGSLIQLIFFLSIINPIFGILILIVLFPITIPTLIILIVINKGLKNKIYSVSYLIQEIKNRIEWGENYTNR